MKRAVSHLGCVEELRSELRDAHLQLKAVLGQYEKLQELMRRLGVLPPVHPSEQTPYALQSEQSDANQPSNDENEEGPERHRGISGTLE